MNQSKYTVAELLRVMQRLRDPVSGCPWDIAQDFDSIVPSTLEECYELAEAIEQGDFPHVAEELGDVLFQVIFYAQMGSEQGLFSFDSVVSTLVEKLLRRHPHVFANGEIEGVVADSRSIEDVQNSWEDSKRQERASRQQMGALADVPVLLPALPRAQKLQKRAAQVGFDWPDHEGPLAKLTEEIAELREALISGDQAHIKEELGDLIFSCVNLARHLDLDAEETLRRASGKFENRFTRMEGLAQERGDSLAELSDQELDLLWNRCKES
ncbi:MAG: nucleoside triphosphate pyrophosphohydrolase [Halioglobus sp.]